MQVFISHSHVDAMLAARVSNALEKRGLKVWDQDRELFPGDNWAREVSQALEESEAMVVLMTPAAIDSPNVLREMEYAIGAKNYSNRLIPVVVGDPDQLQTAKVPWIVRRLPWFDLDDSDVEEPQVGPIAEAILSNG